MRHTPYKNIGVKIGTNIASKNVNNITRGIKMRIMSMTVKCSDTFMCDIKDGEKYVVEGYEGYVPDFMPDDHYGDYVVLDIDLDTGRIVNWRKDKTFQSDLQSFIKSKG